MAKTSKIQAKKTKKEADIYIRCRQCHKVILTTELIGFSLICPYCGKPGNGLSHKNIAQKSQLPFTI